MDGKPVNSVNKGINMSKELTLEEEFDKVSDEATALINEQLDIASAAITKAEEIAEKYGIPFGSCVSPLGQSYLPNSFPEKWKDLSEDKIEELNGEFACDWANVMDGYGWQHSSVC